MAVAVILVPVMMVDAFVMEMAESASFIDRDVGIAFHDVDLIVLVLCHFRIIRVVMMLFRDFFTAATAASAMFVGVAFVVMSAAAAVFMGVTFVIMVMPAATAMFVGVTFVIVVMTTGAAVIVGMAFVFVVMSAGAAMFMGVAFVVMVMPASAVVLVGVTFVVMPAAAALGFFFLVVGMLFGVMGSFLRLMAVAAPTVMYMLFIVFFHGISPYLEWKFSFLSGIILWCYFSILQMHRKWSMRNTLIFQVGQGEAIGLDRAKKE